MYYYIGHRLSLDDRRYRIVILWHRRYDLDDIVSSTPPEFKKKEEIMHYTRRPQHVVKMVIGMHLCL